MVTMPKAKLLFLLLVLAASFLPLLGMLLNVQVGSELRSENRVLASMPAFHWSDVAKVSYFTHLENYFNDHFGFRDWIIYHKHSFDETVLHRVRPDLIRGRDGYLFYKFITERYVPSLFANYPREYMVAVLMGLHDELARRGIPMMIVHYPNKTLIYHDKLPSYWKIETDPSQLPFYQGLEEIQRRGVPVLALARDFLALRTTEEVFTPAEENHCTPQAYFYSLRRMLHTLGELADVPVDLPADFPKVYSAKLENGKGYRNAHRMNTAYEQPLDWTAKEDDGPGRGGRYLFRHPKGVLPSTTVFTDSFFEVLTAQFGPVLLPYFQELRMDYTTFRASSITPQTRLVVLVFSDQSVETHVHRYRLMLEDLKNSHQGYSKR